MFAVHVMRSVSEWGSNTQHTTTHREHRSKGREQTSCYLISMLRCAGQSLPGEQKIWACRAFVPFLTSR